MKYDNLMELFKNRRSIRKFKADPIPDEYVDKIIEAARLAPSGFNTQPWEFVGPVDEHPALIVRTSCIFIDPQAPVEIPLHEPR